MGKAFCFFFGALCALAAVGEPLPVEKFFERPAYSQPQISPDGRHVAVIVRGARRDGLAVVDIEKKAARPVTNFSDADVIEFHWSITAGWC